MPYPHGSNEPRNCIPVKLRLTVDSESVESHGLNIIATIKGVEKPDEKVVLVAHHDNAFGPGACDNATAVAVNLETARVLSNLPPPKRTIEFISVTAEEYGEIGSEAYVKKYVKPDPSKYKAALVMDIIGNGDHLYYITESICLGKLVRNSPEINGFLEKICSELGYMIEVPCWNMPLMMARSSWQEYLLLTWQNSYQPVGLIYTLTWMILMLWISMALKS